MSTDAEATLLCNLFFFSVMCTQIHEDENEARFQNRLVPFETVLISGSMGDDMLGCQTYHTYGNGFSGHQQPYDKQYSHPQEYFGEKLLVWVWWDLWTIWKKNTHKLKKRTNNKKNAKFYLMICLNLTIPSHSVLTILMPSLSLVD